jgi:uncharacterized protein YndB with AHSA1/START domain
MRIEATGPASAEAMWEAYAEPSRWPSWAPQIREVRPTDRIQPGMRGEVKGPAGSRVRFEVTDVDETAGRWTWRVRIGPASLTIAHVVADGRTAVELDGPAPVVVAYAPVARVALARLVRVEG